MKRSARGVGAVFIVAAILLTFSAAAAQPTLGPTQDPAAGARVFGAKGCIKCHAIKGGGGKTAPDLGRIQQPRSLYDLGAALWNHAPRMSDKMRDLGLPRPALDAREVGDLVAFLFTLDYFDQPGRPDLGKRLFSDKKCIVCHQVEGVGGVVGPNLDTVRQYASPIFIATAMWNHGPQMAEMMKARGIARPSFTGGELIDLVSYLGAAAGPATEPIYVMPGRPDEGRRLFTDKRCVECHSAGGAGGKAAPDLTERGLSRSLTQFTAGMWNKAPAMIEAMKGRAIPVPQLRPDEMADIVAYLYSVRYFGQGGDARRGAAVASTKGCLGCHAVGAERGKAAGGLARARGTDSPAGVIAALWNHTFLAQPQKTGWAELTPDQLADLTAYLGSLRPAR
jgi:mono/diheme cytochrome c family protein